MSVHDHRDDAAAYALGALEPAEAEELRRHMRDCVLCKDDVASFREAVNALPAAAPPYRAPQELRQRVMKAVREDARHKQAAIPRRRPRLPALRPAAAVAAAAVTALAVLAGVELTGGSARTRVVNAGVGNAELRVTGTQAVLVVRHLPAPPRGGIYELWVQRGHRPPAPTHTLFSVTTRGTADIGVPGGIHGVSAVLVSAEPAGGTEAPTTTPVIVARVS